MDFENGSDLFNVDFSFWFGDELSTHARPWLDDTSRYTYSEVYTRGNFLPMYLQKLDLAVEEEK